MTTRTVRSSTLIGPLIMAVLMEGPTTWLALRERVKLGNASSDAWLEALRNVGILRVCGYAERDEDCGRSGKRARIFELQKPFAQPDVDYPLIEPRRPSRVRGSRTRSAAPARPTAEPASWDFSAGQDLADAWARGDRPAPHESPTP